MEQLQAEIESIQSQIQALEQERQQISAQWAIPENDSPEEIAEAYRRRAREKLDLTAEMKGIDDAIAALSTLLQQKQSERDRLQSSDQRTPLEQQIDEANRLAQAHAERINQLSDELVEELQALKALSFDLSPVYWQFYNKPFLTGFQSTAVPYVRREYEVWRIVRRAI